jgi:hypothetical protein
MTVVEPNNQGQLIVEVGAEGGSISVLGFRTEGGWRFTRAVGDQTPELIDEAWIQSKSGCVDSWEAALKLLDQYPWWKLYPLSIHPEFRQRIWSAVQERLRNDEGPGVKLSRWLELCHG